MPKRVVAVVGMQFGDEGKGNIESYILKYGFWLPEGDKYNYIVRYHGGANAGESWEYDGKIIISHQVPVGVGTGVYAVFLSGGIINPKRLERELEELKTLGIKVDYTNYAISGRNQVALLHHLLDENRAEDGKLSFGTTRSGIAPGYSDAARKMGITFAEFVGPNFESILRERMPLIEKYYGSRINVPSVEEYIKEYETTRERLKEFMRPESELMEELNRPDANILLAGCQSVGLDVFNGANRYSSSSVTTRMPFNTDKRLGVMKLIQSSVGQRRSCGNGKWITYDEGVTEALRGETDDEGVEIGKTSGRKRDLGYFDGVLVRHNVKVSLADFLAATKLDRIGRLFEVIGKPVLPVCTAYKYGLGYITDIPDDSGVLEECTPVYTEFELDPQDFENVGRLRKMREFRELSPKNRDFFERLGDYLGAEITLLSTGPYTENKIVKV